MADATFVCAFCKRRLDRTEVAKHGVRCAHERIEKLCERIDELSEKLARTEAALMDAGLLPESRV